MNRRQFIALLGGAAVVWPLAARGQQVGKIYRIGILEPIPAARNAANLDALRKGLRELGYVEGQNLVIEYRSADGRAERFPDLASELVRLKVDLIVTRGTPAAISGKKRDRNDSGSYGDDGRPGCHRAEFRASGWKYYGGDYFQHRADSETD
jgi:putative tryptophan/tyrosine transport system substrate-binding protein